MRAAWTAQPDPTGKRFVAKPHTPRHNPCRARVRGDGVGGTERTVGKRGGREAVERRRCEPHTRVGEPFAQAVKSQRSDQQQRQQCQSRPVKQAEKILPGVVNEIPPQSPLGAISAVERESLCGWTGQDGQSRNQAYQRGIYLVAAEVTVAPVDDSRR